MRSTPRLIGALSNCLATSGLLNAAVAAVGAPLRGRKGRSERLERLGRSPRSGRSDGRLFGRAGRSPGLGLALGRAGRLALPVLGVMVERGSPLLGRAKPCGRVGRLERAGRLDEPGRAGRGWKFGFNKLPASSGEFSGRGSATGLD